MRSDVAEQSNDTFDVSSPNSQNPKANVQPGCSRAGITHRGGESAQELGPRATPSIAGVTLCCIPIRSLQKQAAVYGSLDPVFV